MRGRFHCFLVVKKIYNANLNCKFSDNGHTFKCMQIKFEVHVWFSKVSFFHSKIFFKAFITLKNDKKLAFRRFFNRNYDLIGLRSDCGVVSLGKVAAHLCLYNFYQRTHFPSLFQLIFLLDVFYSIPFKQEGESLQWQKLCDS